MHRRRIKVNSDGGWQVNLTDYLKVNRQSRQSKAEEEAEAERLAQEEYQAEVDRFNAKYMSDPGPVVPIYSSAAMYSYSPSTDSENIADSEDIVEECPVQEEPRRMWQPRYTGRIGCFRITEMPELSTASVSKPLKSILVNGSRNSNDDGQISPEAKNKVKKTRKISPHVQFQITESKMEWNKTESNNYDLLKGLIISSLSPLQNKLKVKCTKKEKKIICPKIIKNKKRTTSLNSDDNISKSEYVIIDINSKSKSPESFINITKQLTKTYKPAPLETLALQDDTLDLKYDDKLSFISEKTHSKSKQILQQFEDLHNYVAALINIPHQAVGRYIEDDDVNIEIFSDNPKRPSSQESKIVCFNYDYHKNSPKVKHNYYFHIEKIKMFDFGTPCPY